MVDPIIELLNKTEGRDKVCKTIQYGSRLLKVLNENGDKATYQMFANLQASMADARKLFRLAKSLLEYHKLQQLLNSKTSGTKLIVNILCRVSFFIYWIFDNLFILTKTKFLSSFDKARMQLRAGQFWTLGLIFSLINVGMTYFELTKDYAAVVKKIQ